MSGDTRYPYQQAIKVAEELRALLAPACERIEIAGSLRRKKATVGDMELLCIPHPSENLFRTDLLDEAVSRLLGGLLPLLALRPSIRGVTTYGPKNKLLIHLPSGIGVDIFSADAENFGMSLLVRTGSRDFNVRVMARLKALGMAGHAYPKPGQGGITSHSGEEIMCPYEDVVFRCLGWPFIPPEGRS